MRKDITIYIEGTRGNIYILATILLQVQSIYFRRYSEI